ncbi:MAG: DUF362 domain-containing protein [Aigarchaeota archaeon]|nr:DUF362 domain-containing protein [Aigarchaeota archaeon]
MKNSPNTFPVYLIATQNREEGVSGLLGHLDLAKFRGKSLAVKANFNSADPYPASTHLDTLRHFILALHAAGATKITLGERSGMGDTRNVLNKLGVFDLGGELGFDVVVLDHLPEEAWERVDLPGSHWKNGFLLAKVFTQADVVVQTCCLKTHRFGGHFTLSLKNSVGMVAKHDPTHRRDYMMQLHGSRSQRQKIAEINKAYACQLILMDGVQGFAGGGPDKGRLIEPGVMLSSADRVAIDAVGVAILRLHGVKGPVAEGPIFQQAQIKRAVELKIGVQSPEQIEVVAVNDASQALASQIKDLLFA